MSAASGWRQTVVPGFPPEKLHDDGLRDDWSRWDTPGRTVYIAGTLGTAFRECLAWARMVPSHERKLGRLAAPCDLEPDEVMREVAADFEKLGHLQPGHLPYSWRDSRLIHRITDPDSAGPWIDMEHQATLDALSLGPPSGVKAFTGREEFDRAATCSNDRDVTTRIAQWLRGMVLDDGTEAAGIRFRSRVGNGICRAYWMRRTDLGLAEVAHADAGREIRNREPSMETVTNAWGIRSW